MTIDAMGCQHRICQQIIDQGADCVVGLKGNQGSLRKDVELFFDEYHERGIEGDFIRKSEIVDGNHGRIETRRSTVCPDTEWIRDRHQWLGLKTVIMTEYTRETGGKAETVTRFHIASLEVEPGPLAQCIRDHWQVENSLHRVLDVTFRQDECRIGTGNAAANFITIKHAAMNLPRRTPGKMSLPRKRHSAAWDNDDMEKIIPN